MSLRMDVEYNGDGSGSGNEDRCRTKDFVG